LFYPRFVLTNLSPSIRWDECMATGLSGLKAPPHKAQGFNPVFMAQRRIRAESPTAIMKRSPHAAFQAAQLS